MTLTSRKPKTLLTLILIGCLFATLPAPVIAQNDENADVRRVVDQLFAAFQQKDLTGVMALWGPKSPDFVAGRQTMQQVFDTHQKIELKNLQLNKITVDTNNATVQLVAELSVVGKQAGASPSPLQLIRTVHLVKDAGVWKIWKYMTREDEFAETLVVVRTPEEFGVLLKTRPELTTTDLVRALARKAREFLAGGKQTEALMICDLTLNIAQQISDKRGMSVIFRVKGDVALARGDMKQALEHYEQSLKLGEELGDKAAIGDALNSMGVFYFRQSDYPKALSLFQRNLQIKEELGNKLDIAREWSNIGNVYLFQGDKIRALENYQRSLKLSEEVGNRAGSSATLNNIGNVYFSQGNYLQALEYIQQALKIKQELGDKLGSARNLNNIGLVYSQLGQYVQALDNLKQGAAIMEAMGDKLGVVEAWHYIGIVYQMKEDYTQALAYEQKALKPAEELGHLQLQSEMLHNIGQSYLRLGQYKEALEYASRSASLSEQRGVPDVLLSAKTISGKAHLALNQTDRARELFLESIATIEKLRTQVAGGEREQQRFFEGKIAPYQAMVQLALAQNDTAQALSYAERAKGRVLLDVLSSGRANITKAMTSDELKRDRELSNEIATLNTQLARAKRQAKPPEPQIAEIQAQLDKMRLEYEAFQEGLYAAHPELKVQRGETQVLTLDEAAALLPDHQTAILEYVVTEDKSYLFVLRKPARSKTADLTVHTLNVKSTELAQMVGSFLRLVAERDLTVKQPARRLYDLLIKPVEGQLRGVRRLRIVPDGALWNVPFQALHQGERGYLLEQYAVSYVPSLSVLREMERKSDAIRTHHRPTNARAETKSTLLAMGNPTLNDYTVAKVRVARRDEPLGPLPDAEKEVNFLGRLYGPGSRVLIGQHAQEATMKTEADKYNVLHFATHAILDDRNPLYSHILLSRAENDQNEDGLLEASELMKLDLNAELAVLSACETARGHIAAGEGIIGMSWALFVAGSPSAIVSQWKVDSARSSELMIEFHSNWLRKRGAGKTTMTKSDALRQAALKVFRSSYNHPVYWAGFILIGDDN